METKKNPKVDVRRNSAIYFAVSLALTLFVSNYAINYRTQGNDFASLDDLTIIQPPEEEHVPITKHETPPPPPAPVVPDEIIIEDDEKQIEETIIESTEIDETTEIIDIEDVDEVVDEPEEIDVPFAFIEHVPTFPGCESGNNEKKRKCMSEKITKHVKRKFNTDLAGEFGLTGVQKIHVMFKISKQGEIVSVKSRAPHQGLQKEAERVVNLLPKMKPGKQRGEPVTVSYSLPIIFQVQN